MANEVTKLIIETILGLITTAFAFVAGLAWNDAIQKLIETLLELEMHFQVYLPTLLQ